MRLGNTMEKQHYLLELTTIWIFFFPTEFLMKQKKETKSNQLIKLILEKNIIVLNYKENFEQNA